MWAKMIRARAGKVRRLSADQAGQTTIEWAMMLAVVGLPSIYLFSRLLAVLAEHYRMITFLETLPYP